MKIINTPFENLYIIQHELFSDERGFFIKTYNQQVFNLLGFNLEIKERYFSCSKKNVIRGMHFQTPPDDHIKLVTVISGKIIDVILDIRKNSKTYGRFFSIEINALDGRTMYIPKGFAHGFKSLANNTIVEYNQTSCYSFENDSGIRYDTFGFDWGIEDPIISMRDRSLKLFCDFKSPF